MHKSLILNCPPDVCTSCRGLQPKKLWASGVRRCGFDPREPENWRRSSKWRTRPGSASSESEMQNYAKILGGAPIWRKIIDLIQNISLMTFLFCFCFWFWFEMLCHKTNNLGHPYPKPDHWKPSHSLVSAVDAHTVLFRARISVKNKSHKFQIGSRSLMCFLSFSTESPRTVTTWA